MPKIIDHDKRRHEIVEVAKRIILRGGFEAATMRSIAAEAGFANGALKHYFPGKDSIVAAAFTSILEEMQAGVNATTSSDPAVRLREFLRAPLPQTPEQIVIGRVLIALWEYAMANEELAEIYRGHLADWKQNFLDQLDRARIAGAIKAAPPYDMLAQEYLSTMIGATIVDLMFPAGDRIESYNTYVDTFIERLQEATAVE